jgi:enoyl-CoA hydratase/carnithine racemase
VKAISVRSAAGVAGVTIDFPPINLMTVGVFLELAQVADELAADPSVRVVVLRSANPEWFIAHFDVEAILTFPTDAAPARPDGEINAFHRMCETLRTMPKATIAVIEGRVGGGGSELALSCDMRFATPDAVFSQPEVALGILPGSAKADARSRGLGADLLEEVVALVVDHDERREVDHVDLPDGLHAEFGVLEHLDLGDVVEREPGSRAADRTEVEAAVRAARIGDLA